MKQALNNRDNIHLLVNTFYAKVREDGFIGPVFNSIIKDWPSHLEHLTDFWESNLLLARKYHGNPVQVHQEVDMKMGNSISMEHFGRWLQLWLSTIDEHFTGELAELAKFRARTMASHLFLRIFENRKKPIQ